MEDREMKAALAYLRIQNSRSEKKKNLDWGLVKQFSNNSRDNATFKPAYQMLREVDWDDG